MTDISVWPDPESLAQAAATRVRDVLESSLRWRSESYVGLSVREESKPFLDALAGLDADWDRVVVTQVDERIGGAGDPSDWDSITDRLVGPAAIGADRLIPMPPMTREDVWLRLAEFQRALEHRQHGLFSYDVAQLVLGGRGDVGALRPEDAILDSTRSLDVAMAEGAWGPRAGLTFAALQRSRCIVVLAVGADKAEHVRHLVELDGRVPASQIRHRKIEVFADEDAASLVEH